MGNCFSAETDAERNRSDAIDAELQEASNQSQNEAKLLLLGTGESGKSTVFKQMKIIHKDGYSDAEKRTFIPHARANLIANMKLLIQGARSFGYKFDSEVLVVRYRKIGVNY